MTTVVVWDVVTEEQVRRLPCGEYAIAASFSPDGGRVVTTGMTAAVVWDARTGERLRRLKGHGDRLVSARFFPDGKRVLTTGKDGTARIWDAQTGRQLLAVSTGSGHRIAWVAPSPDGRYLAVSRGRGSTVHDSVTGKVVLSLPAEGLPCFTSDSQRVWTFEAAELTFRDIGSGAVVREFELPERASCVAMLPGGTRLLFVDRSTFVVTLWDLEDGKEVFSVRSETALAQPAHANFLLAAPSPDGKLFLTFGSYDSTVRLWDTETGEEIAAVAGTEPSFAVFSPDGRRVATTECTAEPPYGIVAVWDIE